MASIVTRTLSGDGAMGVEKIRPASRLPWSRRLVLLAGLLASATAGPTAAFAADSIAVRLEWFTNDNHLPLFLAQERGWFKAADLDVTIEDGNGSTTTVQMLGNGQYDIGMASLSTMAIGRASGLAVTSIAGINSNDIGLLVPVESSATKPSDLAGKRVLVTPSSFEGALVESFFRDNGVPSDKITFENVAPNVKLSQYIAGQGDAVISTIPYMAPLVAGKRTSKGILFSDFGYPLPSYGLIASTKTLKAKGEAVKRFVSIVSASWEYILDGHVDEAVAATLKARPTGQVTGPELTEEVVAVRPFFGTPTTKGQPIGTQSLADWQTTLALMEKVKIIPAGTKPADYFTNDYLDIAYGRKIIGASTSEAKK
jgi:NitT/TauT family transport system substrate-binding protein